VDTSLDVYVGQGSSFVTWTYVDSLLDHGPGETVFTTRRSSDGITKIIFGDSINGAIPQTNALISATYKVSAGFVGNINSNVIAEVTFIPGNTNSEAVTYLSATNSVAAYGGADADSLDQLRNKIKAAIATRRRAITLIDYEYLASLVPQVGKVKASSDVYSSVQVYLQTQNDGSTTPGVVDDDPTSAWSEVAENISKYLKDKIPAGTTVSVLPPTYSPLYLDLSIDVDSAYRQDTTIQAVYRALIGSEGLFSYDENIFERTITLSSIISKISSVPGVSDVTISRLDTGFALGLGNVNLGVGEIAYLILGNIDLTAFGGIV
jgi:predicted phage baseplate assembly protein